MTELSTTFICTSRLFPSATAVTIVGYVSWDSSTISPA
jgi:hypothetical protein